MRKLQVHELKNTNPLKSLDFETTDDLEPFAGIIGQDRAEKALSFGLSIRDNPYNIYISGTWGTGRTTFAKEFAKEIALEREAPKDLVYVYNFKEPKTPRKIRLPAGRGKEFKVDVENLVSKLSIELTREFTSQAYEDERREIVRKYQKKNDDLIDTLKEKAKDHGFGVKVSNTGTHFMPIIDGEMISEEEYEELPEDIKGEIQEESEKIQMSALTVMKEIKEYEKEITRQVNLLDYKIALLTAGRLLSPLMYKYEQEKVVLAYFMDMKEEILENIDDFLLKDTDKDEMEQLMPWLQKKPSSSPLSKYQVNVLTDGSGREGAPVIVEHNPTYANLIGEVEYDSEFGNFTTDYMKIKPGALHRADGGFLILQAQDILASSLLWDTLKKAIKTKEVHIEPLREIVTGVAMEGVRPEPANIDVKVILIGSEYFYQALRDIDDDFGKLFKIHAMFDGEMDYTEENAFILSRFISKYTKENDLLPFTANGVKRLLEQASRLAESQKKFTAHFGSISDLLVEASAWAEKDGKMSVSEDYVSKAIAEKEYRENLYVEKLDESILDGTILIDTKGKKVGQINGLAVLSTGTLEVGKPTRITATTFMGKSGVVSIEKEAEMSGAIHDKGVQVLTGYLGHTYAQEFPLSLSCQIGFEQNYGGIDGDSASSTEIYAILSSLSEMPIRQDIAVTGSVNQWGDIQAIGGVTYKVEGFFDLCKSRGLTGKEGVIIPSSNISDLVLKDEVIEAVKNNQFTIYAIDHVEEGLEILLEEKVGKKNKNGEYPEDSIHGKVMDKLEMYYELDKEEE